MNKPLFCTVEVKGLYIEKLILKARSMGITVGSIALYGRHTAHIGVPEGARELFISAAEEFGYTAALVSESPIRRCLGFLRRWSVLFLGLAAALLLLCAFCSRYWFISVSGASAYTPAVLSALSEYGVSVGCAKASVSPSEIREKLLLRFPKIAWIEVGLSGLILDVKLTRGVDAPKTVEIYGMQDIVASESGILLSLTVTAGTPVKEAGELVLKGETLVLGEERTEKGETVPVKAAASAEARVWAEKSITVRSYDLTCESTGNEAEKTTISLFGFPLLSVGEDGGFEDSELIRDEVFVGGAFLPVRLSRETSREVIERKTPCDTPKRIAEAEDIPYSLMLADMARGGEIVDKWAVYSIIDDENILVKMTLELRKDIALPRSDAK